MKYKKYFCPPCLFGYLLILLTSFSLYQQIKPYKDSCIVEGQLIDYIIDTSTDSDMRTRTSYRGVYEFSDGNNTYKAYSITGVGNVNRLLKEVDVEYEKSEPTVNRVKADLDSAYIFFIVMGCVAICGGILTYAPTDDSQYTHESYKDFDD